MIRFILSFAALLLLASACTQAPKAPEAVATESVQGVISGDTVAIDKAASTIGWIGTKVSGYHNGTISLQDAHFLVRGDTIVGGSFILDMKSIADLDLKGEWKTKLEGHLKSPDFFAVDSFPTASFAVTSLSPATPADSATHIVSGNLTLRGVTKQISFPATLSGGEQFRAQARFNLNRKDFGVMYAGKQDDLIRDEINLTLDLRSAAKSAAH
jgi:hypothetical protein